MLQQRVENLIQDGILESQRFALSSDLWRYATVTPHCDVLLTLAPRHSNCADIVRWLVEQVCITHAD